MNVNQKLFNQTGSAEASPYKSNCEPAAKPVVVYFYCGHWTQSRIVNSNDEDADLAQMATVTEAGFELTDFNKTRYGEALILLDGTLLMGDNGLS